MSFRQQNQIWLEIPEIQPLQPTAYSTAGAYRRAQMNQQCLTAFPAWLQAEFDCVAKPDPNSAALPGIWELVNGTALVVDRIRLVLLPTEAIAADELRVPQEWVDLPTWVADYYVAVQVDPEEHWLQIVGYTSHQQLKTTGIYDAGDRTYAMDVDDLLQDMSSLWISRQLYPQTAVRADVAPLPLLAQAQASSLLERLGKPTLIFPRLAIPFQQWGALVAHGGWRQQLYERRQGLGASGTVPQWIQQGLSGFAQRSGWQRQEFVSATVGVRNLDIGIARTLAIAGNAYTLRVFPIGASSHRTWRVELRSTTADRLIPAGFRLRLLTEDLQAMDNNEDVATAPTPSLYIDVVMEPEEGIVWELDPLPEGYDREILRF